MNSRHSSIISAFLFFLLLFARPRSSRSDYSPPECPYPCLPPPTSVANYPPPPPSEPTWGGYPPPPPGTPSYNGYYPPPSGGYLPYYSPPDYALPAPPPPNPIVPWFPFYYRSPSLPPSSASVTARSGAIFAPLLTVFLSILLA
ncbi:hypothetical protein OPV22_014729 [Ensete ventricosum]|uniref:Extensin domain-containing protein n=1 Tax=Ensete ventricosum TaxID=4639 RepID=A0AAV8R3X6_ENSVE|nr:hypothetical protein OPV22_014729 [Ensete ventricosum]